MLVALAFQPARVRVERWANRLVYGQRATPHETLQRFSRGSTDTSDDELLARIPHLVVDGSGASTASVWVRAGDGFETASIWPEDAPRRSVSGSGEFVDPEADLSVPVVHDGELLGGISLVKSAGETVTPQDEALIGSLASGIGLAMRNARLTARLRQRVAELEASRERVLFAADAARRALEHSLDSGPQQTLVAVKVGLGPTRMRAERAGAEKTASLLAQLEGAAGSAIESLRDFAAGIYPPLLEAEGLAVAVSHQAAKSALKVSVHADDVPRYDREIEAAVYFSVLESLQNCAKYSGAPEAWVTLSNGDGHLRFEVRDDGRGFDAASVELGAGLNGIADRLDTVGGTVRIDSTPGRGTVVRGSVPTRERAAVEVSAPGRCGEPQFGLAAQPQASAHWAGSTEPAAEPVRQHRIDDAGAVLTGNQEAVARERLDRRLGSPRRQLDRVGGRAVDAPARREHPKRLLVPGGQQGVEPLRAAVDRGAHRCEPLLPVTRQSPPHPARRGATRHQPAACSAVDDPAPSPRCDPPPRCRRVRSIRSRAGPARSPRVGERPISTRSAYAKNGSSRSTKSIRMLDGSDPANTRPRSR